MFTFFSVDVWDEDGETPVVCHGNPAITLTKKISLKKVLQVINDNAFETTRDYPLILSIENHLCKENQERMANWMEEIFGDKLYVHDPTENNMKQYPSPDELRGKIFVKGSKNKVSEEYPQTVVGQTLMTRYLRANSTAANFVQNWRDNKKEFGYFEDDCETKGLNSGCSNIEEEVIQEVPSPSSLMSSLRTPSIRSKQVHERFSSLISLFQTTKIKKLSEMENRFFYEMCSFTDSKSSNEMKNNNKDLYRKITRTNMIRIYPTPSRIQSQLFSANYCPLSHWDAGAQMVALNYQTTQGMLQNSALFQINGNCGYVLKPGYLRDPKNYPVPTNERIATLSIRIIGGIFVNVLKATDSIQLSIATRIYYPDKENIELRDLYKCVQTRVIKNNGKISL